MVVDVTATRIVAGAIATRDFMPVHHDRDYANAPGRPGHLHEHPVRHRLLQPVPHRLGRTRGHGQAGWPSDSGCRSSRQTVLTYTGSVVATREDGDGIVEVALRATTELGDHVTGTAVLRLPRRAPAAQT